MNELNKVDVKKIQIAKEFIELHKSNDVADWQPLDQYDVNKKYITIFNNLMGNVYGECHGLNFVMDDKQEEVIKEATEFEIEISCFQSKFGHTDLFEFEYSENDI